MKAEEIIHRLRKEIDLIYEKYEGHPLVGKEALAQDFCNAMEK